ncbi:hypothetical protein [Streptomyces sp. NPDC001714]|uniref:hypothetical protein n=1 Tax=Streptomyces sp. NPDC001714 TaxID=3364603 RepID=UPI00367E928D
MYTRGRRLRFTAVSAMVVLALTGFSSGRGQHSSDGGGCSSSRQDHDSSTPSPGSGGSHGGESSGGDANASGTSTSTGTHRPRPTRPATPATSSSGATARPQKNGTAVLVHCASPEDPYATVEVRNPNTRDGLFTVRISFRDKHGFVIIDTSDQVLVSAKDKARLRVPVAGTGRVDEIDHCDVRPRATVDR